MSNSNHQHQQHSGAKQLVMAAGAAADDMTT
jgi:hypothetical protein